MKLGIKLKLMIIMVAANCVVAGMMYWLGSKSFDEGFLDYITQVELEKLTPYTEELGVLYQQKQGWDWIHDEHYIWRQTIDYHVRKRPIDGNRRPPRGQFRPPARDGFNPPRRPPPRQGRRDDKGYTPQVKRIDNQVPNFTDHILLRDEFKQLVIGRPRPNQEIIWLAINVGDETVGEVGLIYRNNESSNLEKYFSDKQKSVFANILMMMLFIALLVAFLLSRKLMGHINVLQKGMSALVKGHYEQVLTVTSNDELGQLASDFNFLAQTLKQNQQSRQQWIADISHELRTPVAILKGELEALIDGVRQVDEGTLLSLQQEADRLTLLINDLHELSLSDLGALNYVKEVTDLDALVSDFIEDQISRTELSQLKVTFEGSKDPSFVLIDGDRIEQCFKNLLQNTLRYTDMPGQLVIAIKHDVDSIIMTWEDSSPGVSKGDLSHLFERLYRVEKSRNRAKGGAGLGLSICKNILDAHEVEISIYQSKLGGLGFKLSFKKVKQTL